MWGRFIFLLLLLGVCSVGPGFFLARKLPWSPAEKLCAALGLSLLEASLVLVFALLLHHMVRQAMAGSGVPRSAAKAAAGSSHGGATAADARRPRRLCDRDLQ